MFASVRSVGSYVDGPLALDPPSPALSNAAMDPGRDLASLGIAAALGLLVGLQRERDESNIAGIRFTSVILPLSSER